MILALEIINGPLEGKKIQIHEGFQIGRRSGDLLLDQDVKVSSLHAEVELDNKSQLVLVDKDSANAMILNQRRVRRVALLPGVLFRIGSTDFRVHELSPEEAAAAEPPKTGLEYLQEAFALIGSQKQATFDGPEIQILSSPITLEFIQGVQAETKYFISYVPRVAGLGHLDLELREPDCPDQAFQLIQDQGLLKLIDLSNGRVKINSRDIEADVLLGDGDVISIGGSKMKVRYL